MKKIPLVSIIISFYKKKKYIKKTLNSILNQSYKNYEIIFIYDDEDKSDLIYVKSLLKKFKKKKLIINYKNLGVANCRNKGIKYSKGSYLAFIDSDDIWKKNKLKNQIKFMEENFFDLTFTFYNILEKKKIIKAKKIFFKVDYNSLKKSNYIGLSTVIIKRKILSKIIFPNLKTQEDYALWLKLLRKGIRIGYLNKILASWRKTENSLSSNVFQKLIDAFKMYYIYEKKNFIFSIFSVLVLSYNKLINKHLY